MFVVDLLENTPIESPSRGQQGLHEDNLSTRHLLAGIPCGYLRALDGMLLSVCCRQIIDNTVLLRPQQGSRVTRGPRRLLFGRLSLVTEGTCC